MSWHKKISLTKEQEEFLESDFVELFSTDIGQRVATKILTDLHFFSRCENQDEVALNNYAKQFMSYLIENPFVVEVLEFAGSWDFAVRFQHKDTGHLNQIINKLETSSPYLIDKYSIFFISKSIFLPYNVLFEKYAFWYPSTKIQPHRTDNFDLKILSALSSDGRKSLAQLEEELKENRMTIYYRIKKMIKSGLIQHFRPSMFVEKLGLHWYVVKIKLSQRSDEKIKTCLDNARKHCLQLSVLRSFPRNTDLLS